MTDNILPEAPASLNFTVSALGYALQLTLRDTNETVLMQRFARFVGHLEDEYGVKAPGKPGELAFEAETLMPKPDVERGKVFWIIKGGNYKKYGVTVWPEVMRAAGLEVEDSGHPIDTRRLPTDRATPLKGWTVVYELNDNGNPEKVIELRPPASASAPNPPQTAKVNGHNGAQNWDLSWDQFRFKVQRDLGVSVSALKKILTDTGKYEGGYEANRARVYEMYQDVKAALKK